MRDLKVRLHFILCLILLLSSTPVVSLEPAHRETAVEHESTPLNVSLYLLNAAITDASQRPIVQGLVRLSSCLLRVSAEKQGYALEAKMSLDVDIPFEIQADRQLTHWEGNDVNVTIVIPVTVSQNGDFLVSATAVNTEIGFTSTRNLKIRVAETQEQLQQSFVFEAYPIPLRTFLDSSPRSESAAAPSNYAHVFGIATTYEYTGGTSYMLRGIKMELWDTLLGTPTSRLKTLYTVEASSDSDYGLTPNNFVTSGGTWYHIDQSGYFDFGNIYVGSGHKDLIIRMVFVFHANGDGTTEGGTEKLSVLDRGNFNIVFWQDYGPIECSSGQEVGGWIQAPSLGSSGGEDEAAHVYYDITKTYSYFQRLGAFEPSNVVAYIKTSDTNAPYCDGSSGNIYYNGWTNNYLTYAFTDSLIHEYAHALHWQQRGGSFPPLAPGDTNHGGCLNSNSADGLTEGWARYVPTVIMKDPLYHWGSTDSTWDIRPNSGPNAECDRSEWTFGAILWNIRGDIGGGSHDWFKKTAQTLANHDPNLVETYYWNFISDWGYHDQVKQVFANHNVVYEYTTTTTVTVYSTITSTIWTTITSIFTTWRTYTSTVYSTVYQTLTTTVTSTSTVWSTQYTTIATTIVTTTTIYSTTTSTTTVYSPITITVHSPTVTTTSTIPATTPTVTMTSTSYSPTNTVTSTTVVGGTTTTVTVTGMGAPAYAGNVEADYFKAPEIRNDARMMTLWDHARELWKGVKIGPSQFQADTTTTSTVYTTVYSTVWTTVTVYTTITSTIWSTVYTTSTVTQMVYSTVTTTVTTYATTTITSTSTVYSTSSVTIPVTTVTTLNVGTTFTSTVPTTTTTYLTQTPTTTAYTTTLITLPTTTTVVTTSTGPIVTVTVTELTVCTPYDDSIGSPGQENWYVFSASAGTPYIIETSNLGGGMDTYIYLYDTDGVTEIAHDDDSGSEFLASKIEWTCPVSGDYYVKVRHYWSGGTGTYTIHISQVQYAVTFYTNPTSFVSYSTGTITFDSATYVNGEGGSYSDGDYSATANAPADYRFEFWQYSGSSASGIYVPDIYANPTTVEVRGDGWLKAVFSAKITFHTNPASVGSIIYSIGYGSTIYTDGQSRWEVSLPPDYSNTVIITANIPSGYTFSGWSTSGSVSVSDPSSNPVTLTVNGPGVLTATFYTGPPGINIIQTPPSSVGAIVCNDLPLVFEVSYGGSTDSRTTVTVQFDPSGFTYTGFTAIMDSTDISNQFTQTLGANIVTLTNNALDPDNGVLTVTLLFHADAEGTYIFQWSAAFSILAGTNPDIKIISGSTTANNYRYVLHVQSRPVPGFSINWAVDGGSGVGTTSFDLSYPSPFTAELSTEMEQTVGGQEYMFSHWEVDGVEVSHNTVGWSVIVTVDGSHPERTAVAVYTTPSRSTAWDRIVDIITAWPGATPEERAAMWEDIVNIISEWPTLPPS